MAVRETTFPINLVGLLWKEDLTALLKCFLVSPREDKHIEMFVPLTFYSSS